MSTLFLSDTCLFFEEAGSGKPLLLLGDKGYTMATWVGLSEALKQHFHVITPELRGSGQSPLGQSPLTVTLLKEDIRALLDTLNLRGLAIFGVGLGAKVAVKLAAEDPEYVSSLVLAKVSHGGPEGELYKPEVLKELFLLSQNEAYQQQLLAEVGCKLSKELRSLKPSVLIVSGEADDSIDRNVLQKFRMMIPGSQFSLVPGGSDFILSHPEALAKVLTDWFK